MSIPLMQVDAFTNEPYRGNPAAICLLSAPCEDVWMQAVAAEMNLSETAFLVQQEDGYNLRWFTPKLEVDLCGHATLASAHVLWSEGRLCETETARFHTRSGLLTTRMDADGWIEMDFPTRLATPAAPPEGLLASLNVSPLFVGRDVDDYLIEVDSPQVIDDLEPDFGQLAQIETRGVIVTSHTSRAEVDFVSRFFAPAAGVPEDPVTGSAHCSLASYWGPKLGKTAMVGYQASPRGGTVRVKHQGERVLLSGQAVTVLRGELCG